MDMNPTHQVILNPTAGSGRAGKLRPELERELVKRSVEYEVRETAARGHAIDLARLAAARGIPTIVAAGGDGTIHEVANGILQAHVNGGRPAPTLAVVPTGTGNDFVKVVDGARAIPEAYDTLASGTVRRFDAGLVEWEGGQEFFVNGMGTGIDVEVVRQFVRLPRVPGVPAVAVYLVALLRALAVFRPIPLRIRLDGSAWDQEVMIVAIGNGICLGGGFYLCPGALPDDGRFDVCVVDRLSLMQIAQVIPRVLRGTHTSLPTVKMKRAQVIEIEALGPDPLFFQLDGELREPSSARWVRITLHPGALPVVGATRPGAPLAAPQEDARS
jgi:YegS/Rv2252/BmrU family lipid kinase